MRKLLHDITFAVFVVLILATATFLFIFLIIMGVPQ